MLHFLLKMTVFFFWITCTDKSWFIFLFWQTNIYYRMDVADKFQSDVCGWRTLWTDNSICTWWFGWTKNHTCWSSIVSKTHFCGMYMCLWEFLVCWVYPELCSFLFLWFPSWQLISPWGGIFKFLSHTFIGRKNKDVNAMLICVKNKKTITKSILLCLF